MIATSDLLDAWSGDFGKPCFSAGQIKVGGIRPLCGEDSGDTHGSALQLEDEEHLGATRLRYVMEVAMKTEFIGSRPGARDTRAKLREVLRARELNASL